MPAASIRAWEQLTSVGFSVTLVPGGHDIAVSSGDALVAEVAAACRRALREKA
ncbi:MULTISPECIES: hypothetical protein [unclassified Frankia]